MHSTATSGPCRSGSDATATGPASSPGARPMTWRRSGCSNRRCATRRWRKAEDQRGRPQPLVDSSQHGHGSVVRRHQRPCSRVLEIPGGFPALPGGLLSGMKTIPILPQDPEVFGTFPGYDRKPHQADCGSVGLPFRPVIPGIVAPLLSARCGTVWVSDQIQTRVYRRRSLPGWEEPEAKKVRTIGTPSAPLSRIPLMTVDHHVQGRPPSLDQPPMMRSARRP